MEERVAAADASDVVIRIVDRGANRFIAAIANVMVPDH
jgi:predicted ribosome-associated RNA-binding protein Tma20